MLGAIKRNKEMIESIQNTWYDDPEERSEMEQTMESIRCENDYLMDEYRELTGEYLKTAV